MTTLYSILKISPDATQDEIKIAFRKQAHCLHPDKNPGNPEAAKEGFQAVQESYKILKDPIKRKRYDETGRTKTFNIEDEAIRVISALYFQIAERADFISANYLTDVTRALQNNLRQVTSDLKLHTESSKKLNYIINNTIANEMFISVLKGKLAEFTSNKAHAAEAKEVISKALDIIDTFEYNGTVPQQFQTTGSAPWDRDSFHEQYYMDSEE